MDHPLLQHKLSILRDENTGVKDFREVVSEIATLMCYEATRDLPLEEVEIKTPITTAKFKTIAGKKLAIVPVLRAGLGMVDGILTLIPSAKVGHIGLYRDPDTLEPVEYYCKMPNDIAEREVIILDPMLATGGSASAAIQFIKNYEVKNIKLMNIIAAPEGGLDITVVPAAGAALQPVQLRLTGKAERNKQLEITLWITLDYPVIGVEIQTAPITEEQDGDTGIWE